MFISDREDNKLHVFIMFMKVKTASYWGMEYFLGIDMISGNEARV